MKSTDWNKLAKKYFLEVASPFQEGVKNPLFDELDSIKNKGKKSVIDIGTGIGNLIPYLSEKFEKVTAIDFSQKMIEIARKNKAKNVKLLVKDARDLSEFHESFHVAVAVNSIILPSIKDVNKMFKEVYDVLKPKGIFIGIFPSVSSDLYRAMLTFEKELEETGDESLARKRTYRYIGSDTYDYLLGIYDYEGRQKHYYGFELKYRMKKAGFRNIRLRKVLYPWKLTEDPSLAESKEPSLWDMLAYGEK